MSGKLSSIMASTNPLITFLMDDEQLKRLDDFRFAHRFSSRGEAIRWLIEAGYKAPPPQQQERPARRKKSSSAP